MWAQLQCATGDGLLSFQAGMIRGKLDVCEVAMLKLFVLSMPLFMSRLNTMMDYFITSLSHR